MNVVEQREKALEDYLSSPSPLGNRTLREYHDLDDSLVEVCSAFRTGWDAHEKHRWEGAYRYIGGGREA